MGSTHCLDHSVFSEFPLATLEKYTAIQGSFGFWILRRSDFRFEALCFGLSEFGILDQVFTESRLLRDGRLRVVSNFCKRQRTGQNTHTRARL